MLRTVIRRKEMGEFFHLLNKVFDMRMTFFDAEYAEVDIFNIKAMSNYCAVRRKSEKFNRKCIACDKRNVIKAHEQGNIHVYRCHAGLIEGVVPLRDIKGHFLGAIVFGQQRPEGQKHPKGLGKDLARIYHALPESTMRKTRDIAQLLQYTSEAIIRHELIRYHSPNWAEALEEYIEMHLAEKITIADLANMAGRSPSYISHHFKAHFGTSPNSYIRVKRLEKARPLLDTEALLSQIAASCGFYDEFHFSKTFKVTFGISPARYRERKHKTGQDS